eukprot:GHVN01035228.1.p2 GENE.GHVN01035228.1~~GHVN01035228.1.p2  ORF type:complete len:749 (-),score=119.75 GHVN01035228.1:1109-3355(-)
MDEDSGAVRVVVRFRPLNRREIELNSPLCVNVPPPTAPETKSKNKKPPVPQFAVINPGGPDRTFQYDHVFDINTAQPDVYDAAAKPIVECVLKGFNGTVMAYGQTGSGKTYSMQGTVDFEKEAGEDEGVLTDGMGVIPRMIHTVFGHIACADEHIEFQLKLSIFEIYMEAIKDLLDTSGTRTNLKIREDKVRGVFVEDLTEWSVASVEEVFACMRLGQKQRSTASTKMNPTSSRSHLVFQLTIIQRNAFDLSQKVGKLYLIDLAGSEKLSKTGAEGMTMEEGKLINKSLSCLGNVINALTNPKGRGHIPYRDSKLTRVLQDSLGGNSQTCLICTASPALDNEAETLSTMRFGQRAKAVQNKPVINEERSVEELERLLGIANATIEEHEAWIETLEAFIKDKGLPLPEREKKKKHKAEKHPKVEGAEGEDEYDEDRDLEDIVQDQKVKLKALSEQITAISAELGESNGRVAELEREKRSLQSKVEDGVLADQQEDKRDEQAVEIAKLQIELAAIQEESKTYKQKYEELRLKGGETGLMDTSAVEEAAATEVDKSFKPTSQLAIDVSKVSDESLANKIKELVCANSQLEKDVEVEKRKSQKLKEMIKEGEKPLKHKLTQLDKSLEHLTMTYQKLASQNSALKVECQMAEKRAQRKETQNTKLEKNLADSRQRYEKLVNQCATLTSAIEQLQQAGGMMAPSLGGMMTSRSFGGGGDPNMLMPMRAKPNVSRSLRGGQTYGKALNQDEKGAS